MAMDMTGKMANARARTCLALDVPRVEDAVMLAGELSDLIGSFKIGKQLHTAAGNQAVDVVGEIHKRQGQVFLDLKYHDTPQTVYGAAAEAAVPGVYMFNVHVAGGEDMCRKAVEGAYEGAMRRGIPRPKVIGVTVLTSIDDGDLAKENLGVSAYSLMMTRTDLALEWGLDGIVCPANAAGKLERVFGSDFLYVTPGIEWKGKAGAGQKQLYTPDRAVQDCKSSILVLGSAVTKAQDRRQTSQEILQAMASHL